MNAFQTLQSLFNFDTLKVFWENQKNDTFLILKEIVFWESINLISINGELFSFLFFSQVWIHFKLWEKSAALLYIFHFYVFNRGTYHFVKFLQLSFNIHTFAHVKQKELRLKIICMLTSNKFFLWVIIPEK